MRFLYNFVIFIAGVLLKILAPFNSKLNLFVKGRKDVFQQLKENISDQDKVVWFHCASLGEFEQGRPVMEDFKQKYPSVKIVLTFFSPSGYEVKKNYEFADVICYLPLDSPSNVRKFLKLSHPFLVLFVKYEFWPNYLSELQKQAIPTFLISGIFRADQLFFKSYGVWMRNKLKAFTHFFIQDENSLQLIQNVGFQNATLTGDTRFDRVYAILKSDNNLDFINRFKGDSYTLVAGSTWKKDEELLVNYISTKATADEKFIIAPHNIKPEEIIRLKNSLKTKTVLFSEKEGKNLNDYQVFIIDTMGILTKIYSVADVAYVGGGYTKSGIHNILEPATFGIPIVIGPNYRKFKEASDLIDVKACVSTNEQEEFSDWIQKIKNDTAVRTKMGLAAKLHIEKSLGATEKISAFAKRYF